MYNAALEGNVGDYYNVSSSAHEVSALGLPYAFFTRSLLGFPQGFPAVFQVLFVCTLVRSC
jgi:hypothetical protein